MKNKLLSILLHPLFLAFVISLVIIYFLPDYFTKYKVEFESQGQFLEQNFSVSYEDLNGDHIAEKITTQTNKYGNASFIISSGSDEIIDQWNFDKKFATGYNLLYFFDLDKNGFKEIYLTTQENDSIFFNRIEPLNKKNDKRIEIFIDTIKVYDHKFQISSALFQFDRINTNPQKEAFLMINSGFSGYPRNLYKVNVQNNHVIRSPHLVNHSYPFYLSDLDKDGIPELLFSSVSSCNSLDSIITKKSDYSSWLTVLDNDLNFLFEPVENKGPYSSLRTMPIKDRNGNYNILCISDFKKEDGLQDKVSIYNSSGKKIQEKILQKGKYYIYPGENENEFVLINKNKGLIKSFDCDLNELETFLIEPKNSTFPIDIEEDGENEWISIHPNGEKVTIFRAGFMDPVDILLPNKSLKSISYGIKEMKNTLNELYFQKGSNYYVYKYGENPLYYYKYLFYLSIFLTIWGMLWLARKGQQIKMQKQRAIEDQISQLQIKTLKNQVDPHFVFNAVNTISEMTLSEDKFEADRFISKFSKLMRETLQKSDRITTTLQEEIDYVENYIQLQQIRFNNDFQYQIKKGLDVDYQMQVPNHVIYTYVENAIKHGLSGRSKGSLFIEIRSITKGISIIIENNGAGIDTSSVRKKNSTGNGMKIMEKMYVLYEKLYHKKISHQMTELKDNEGNILGVRIEVIISK